jgi:hypothetical protein
MNRRAQKAHKHWPRCTVAILYKRKNSVFKHN